MGINQCSAYVDFVQPVYLVLLLHRRCSNLNHSLHTLCNLIVRGIVIDRELVFYSKYIDWDDANKWVHEDHLIRWKIKIRVSVDCSQ